MNLQRLENQGLIEKVRFNANQVKSNLKRARRDLATSKANLSFLWHNCRTNEKNGPRDLGQETSVARCLENFLIKDRAYE